MNNINELFWNFSFRWVHDYQNACVDKLERFLRGEAFLRATHGINGGSRTPNLTFSTQTSRSRSDSGRSSPISRLTPIKTTFRARTDSYDSAISP